MARRKGGRPTALSPEKSAAARDAYAAGASAEDIAQELGCSERTVYRALAERQPSAPAASLFVDLPSDWTAEDYVRQEAEDARRRAHEARATGDHRTASKAARDAVGLAAVLARLEGQRAQHGDVVTFTRDELEAGARLVQERLAALAEDARANGGLTCVACGAALRLADAESNGGAATSGAGH